MRGIYLWGPVGRGKSFLMDEFFRLVPLEAKQRVHFHRFMQDIHHQLRELQGQADPLRIIAERMAEDTRLLCLDEFHVTDIGDAMLMRGLLEGLFERGMALVTTSNQRPDELYEHGLQRAQFQPAIELIKANTEVIELDGEQDYRLRTLERAGVYHWPLDAAAHEPPGSRPSKGWPARPARTMCRIEIEGRAIRALRLAPGTAWFDFDELCEGPRGTADYIELARRYHTVLVSGVPQFGPGMAESMRRFTWLVDEFYDRHVKLIVAAEVPSQELYAGMSGDSGSGAHAQPADRDADRAVSEPAAPGMTRARARPDPSARHPTNCKRRPTMTKFKAYRIFNEDGKVVRPAGRDDARRAGSGRSGDQDRVLERQLQGRPGRYRRRQDHPALPLRRRYRRLRHGRVLERPALQGGRSGHLHQLRPRRRA